MLILKEKFGSPCVLLLGGFDGLHLGHQVLLNRAKTFSKPVGITTILGGKEGALFTREEREFLFERAGLDFAIEWEFTDSFRETSAEDFLKELFFRVNAECVVCGEDFRFGKDAEGTPELLRRLSPCPVLVQETVKELSKESGNPQKISSSVCKSFLKAGELSRLHACLVSREEDFFDFAYFVLGRVEHGRQKGRQYGFPTINLSVPAGKLLPPDGVYGGICATEKGNFPAMIHLGARPTFGVEERKIEAHLFGFEGDLYGTQARVYPTEFLRPIVKFSSEEELKNQLRKDKERICR